jgi:helix-turn-helix protein
MPALARPRLHPRRSSRARGCQGKPEPVSLDLQKRIWDDPEPKGAALTVLLLLASYVPHERWMRGDAPLAWPSQNTIARKCNCRRSTVQLALEELQRLGKIKDTGMRKTRGSVVWELYPLDEPDLTDCESSRDMTDQESGEEIRTPDLTDPEIDLTDPRSDLTDDESRTGPNIGHKRELETNQQRDAVEMRARACARDSVEGEDLSAELAEVEELLERRPADRILNGRRDELLAAVGSAS